MFEWNYFELQHLDSHFLQLCKSTRIDLSDAISFLYKVLLEIGKFELWKKDILYEIYRSLYLVVSNLEQKIRKYDVTSGLLVDTPNHS